MHNSTMHISPQFHVVFDDWFSTVSSDIEFPDDPPPGWYDIFNESRYQYVFDDETSLELSDEWLTPEEITQKRASEHSQQIRSAQEKRISNSVMGSSAVPQRETEPDFEPPTEATNPSTPHKSPNSSGKPPGGHQREDYNSSGRPPGGHQREDSQAPQRELFPTIRSPQREPAQPPSSQALEVSVAPSPSRHPQRIRKEIVRYPRKEPAFMHHFSVLHANDAAVSAPPSVIFKETQQPHQVATVHLADMVLNDRCCISGAQPNFSETKLSHDTKNAAFATKKKNNDPDSLMYHEAIVDGDRKLWLEAMDHEIKELEKMECWNVVPRAEATTRVIPSTWACRGKRYPDGRVKKCRSRFCVRGDLEGDVDPWETYAPGVSSSTVRFVLVMCLVFGLTTWCMDFTNAFVHAELRKEEHYYTQPPGDVLAVGRRRTGRTLCILICYHKKLRVVGKDTRRGGPRARVCAGHLGVFRHGRRTIHKGPYLTSQPQGKCFSFGPRQALSICDVTRLFTVRPL
jgi:hypothetical protein